MARYIPAAGGRRVLQLATLSRPPSPIARRIVTAADIARNEACLPACTAAAVVLRGIPDPIDQCALEVALEQGSEALGGTDWLVGQRALRLLGYKILVRSGLLEAIAEVSLRAAHQARGFMTYHQSCDCGEKLQRAFHDVLGKAMMRMYKKMVEDDAERLIPQLNAEVLEGWELFVKKGCDTTRYSNAIMMQECVAAVEDLIDGFGERHNIDSNCITDHVLRSLYESLYGTEWSNSETEDDDTDGDSDFVDAS